jgi:hypothetical protein
VIERPRSSTARVCSTDRVGPQEAHDYEIPDEFGLATWAGGFHLHRAVGLALSAATIRARTPITAAKASVATKAPT